MQDACQVLHADCVYLIKACTLGFIMGWHHTTMLWSQVMWVQMRCHVSVSLLTPWPITVSKGFADGYEHLSAGLNCWNCQCFYWWKKLSTLFFLPVVRHHACTWIFNLSHIVHIDYSLSILWRPLPSSGFGFNLNMIHLTHSYSHGLSRVAYVSNSQLRFQRP